MSAYLSQQSGDDVQWCLVDGLVLQRGGEGHVHKRPDLLQHHLPPAWVAQNLPVLVDLFLEEEEKATTNGERERKMKRKQGERRSGGRARGSGEE